MLCTCKNETTNIPPAWREHARVARWVLWELLTALPRVSKPSQGAPNTHCNYSFLLTAPAQHNCEACWGFATAGKDVKGGEKKKGAPAVLQDHEARLLHIIETTASWLAASVGGRAGMLADLSVVVDGTTVLERRGKLNLHPPRRLLCGISRDKFTRLGVGETNLIEVALSVGSGLSNIHAWRAAVWVWR